MEEIWKNIKGFSNYKVSNLGKIKNKKNKFLKLQEDKDGYLIAYLYNDDKKIRSIRVHRLVAGVFISNNQNKPQVNHKDGDKQNNCVNNLEWVTNKENVQHAWKIGLHHKKYGKEHNNAKKIIQYTLNGKYIRKWDSIVEASKYYNTTLSNIWHCLKGYNKTAVGYIWKYLK